MYQQINNRWLFFILFLNASPHHASLSGVDNQFTFSYSKKKYELISKTIENSTRFPTVLCDLIAQYLPTQHWNFLRTLEHPIHYPYATITYIGEPCVIDSAAYICSLENGKVLDNIKSTTLNIPPITYRRHAAYLPRRSIIISDDYFRLIAVGIDTSTAKRTPLYRSSCIDSIERSDRIASPDERMLACAFKTRHQGTLEPRKTMIIQTTTGKIVKIFENYSFIGWHENENKRISLILQPNSNNKKLDIWQLRRKNNLKQWKRTKEINMDKTFIPYDYPTTHDSKFSSVNRNTLAIVTKDKRQLLLYNLSKNTILQAITLPGNKEIDKSVMFSPNGSFIAAICYNSNSYTTDICIWDASSLQSVEITQNEGLYCDQICWINNKELLATYRGGRGCYILLPTRSIIFSSWSETSPQAQVEDSTGTLKSILSTTDLS